ncbi:MAG TPA: TetR/AcrR family transcriptional regulator [Candidatus Limnocylindrales bacterium]|nr:TetR/AcrR family transcriptional regulator [Candidatus Limnocylindrales bacterium]
MVELSRRRAIEDVASELFRSHGYAATSVRDIARALDIQGPSLYAHVTSKEDVLWAIVDRAASRFEAAAEAALASRGRATPSEALEALVRAHVRVIADDVGAAGVFVHEWRALGAERREAVLARRDAYERRFRELVADGIASGEFQLTDPALAATAILSALNGIPAWYRPGGRLSAERVADQFVDLVLRMLQGASR